MFEQKERINKKDSCKCSSNSDCPNGIDLPGWHLCGKCNHGICLTGKYEEDGNCAGGDKNGKYKLTTDVLYI